MSMPWIYTNVFFKLLLFWQGVLHVLGGVLFTQMILFHVQNTANIFFFLLFF